MPTITSPCPLCDLALVTDTTVVFALGVMLGRGFDLDRVREFLCAQHRTRYSIAQLSTLIHLQKLEATSTT